MYNTILEIMTYHDIGRRESFTLQATDIITTYLDIYYILKTQNEQDL